MGITLLESACRYPGGLAQITPIIGVCAGGFSAAHHVPARAASHCEG
ncbi:hypothetical protein EDWATA_02395 [Edwardsiella tarda ATCC 23685]|uniref:Uncharacterized protein n=1 Tax=Edwardsiella tarda ATCC 23685 TaxID=500638 RepID=D4F6L4_EDWTA|nr:hypothetical protein EDWATA_02395 [Edwardsiella tarda ATCC 23685]